VTPYLHIVAFISGTWFSFTCLARCNDVGVGQPTVPLSSVRAAHSGVGTSWPREGQAIGSSINKVPCLAAATEGTFLFAGIRSRGTQKLSRSWPICGSSVRSRAGLSIRNEKSCRSDRVHESSKACAKEYERL
jgi:hypothetical protein